MVALSPRHRRAQPVTGALLYLSGSGRVFLLLLVVWATVLLVFLLNINAEQQQKQQQSLKHQKAAAAVNNPIMPGRPNNYIRRNEEELLSWYNNNSLLPIHPPPTFKDSELSFGKVLILTTDHGELRIVLMPHLSPGSVRYIHQLVAQQCARCHFHRLNKPNNKTKGAVAGFLLGVMANHKVPLNSEPGPCPHTTTLGLVEQTKNNCTTVHNAAADEDCGVCHGPILRKGMVGWVKGTVGGPDFFINNHQEPLRELGTHYTVFGRVRDDDSYEVIDDIMGQPTSFMKMQILEDRVPFRLTLVE